MFDAFDFDSGKNLNKKALTQTGFESYCSQDMIVKAQNLLCTSYMDDEAYLGAITVLMLNGAM